MMRQVLEVEFEGKKWKFHKYAIPHAGDMFLTDYGVLKMAPATFTEPRAIFTPCLPKADPSKALVTWEGKSYQYAGYRHTQVGDFMIGIMTGEVVSAGNSLDRQVILQEVDPS